MPEINDYGNDRFIANEIEILKSNNIRERIAKILLDTLVKSDDPKSFSILLTDIFGEDKKPARFLKLPAALGNVVQIEQKRGLRYNRYKC